MRQAPAARRRPTRAEQFGIPRGDSRRARVERVHERGRARDPPAHPRSAQVRAAAEAHQPAGNAAPLRCHRQPPGRGEIEHLRVAPNFADDAGEARASYAFLHRPQRSTSIARLDMDEVLRRQAKRIDSSRFEDRHAVLDPEQGFRTIDLGQEEARPAPVARVCGEEFGKGGFPPLDFEGRGTAVGGGGAPPTRCARHLPCKCRGGDIRPCGDSSAGDQRQASCHTTHNVSFCFCSCLAIQGQESMLRLGRDPKFF